MQLHAPCSLPSSRPTKQALQRLARPAQRARRSQDRLRARAFAEDKSYARGVSGLDVEYNGRLLRPTNPKAWEIVCGALQDAQVNMVSGAELQFARDRGVPVIDVRPPEEFTKGHVKGSRNIPLFQLISGWDARSTLRRAGFAFFGVLNGTELNPAFHRDILAVAKEQGAVLLCATGGTMDATQTSDRGRQSRSLMAAYELVREGVKDISVLKGGFYDWRRAERPFEEGDGNSKS